jgi:hypothetical protein
MQIQIYFCSGYSTEARALLEYYHPHFLRFAQD